MGKASSSKKVARAAKAAGRPGTKKNYTWPAAIGAVVVLGVVLVIASFGGSSTSEVPPQIGDHWHAAYGVYDCDHFVPPFADAHGDRTGIHTHQDGLMHIHPFVSRVVGTNATIGVFAEEVDLELSDTAIDGPNIDRENGDECSGGETGTLRLLIWDSPSDTEPTVRTEDLAAYNPPDASIWVLAFAPEDADIPPPPSAINLQDPTAAEEGREPPSATSTTLPTEGDTPEDEGADTDPAPPADESTTTTSAAP